MQIACHHCGSVQHMKNGVYKGVQRYLCTSCRRSFTSRGERFSRLVKEKALLMHLNNVGIRKIALFLGASPAAVLKWIRKAHERLSQDLLQKSEQLKSELPDVIEMDEIYTFVKKNCKGRSYGLLIAGDKVALLPMSSETKG